MSTQALSVEALRGLFSLESKVAFVTGGASGLGYAIARGFAAFGARVAVTDLDGAAAERAAEDIAQESDRQAQGFSVDVTKPEMIEAARAEAVSRLGDIDVLVNAAGNNCRKPMVEMSPQEFDHILATHMRGTFLCTRAIAPGMIERRSGSVINIASIIGHVALVNVSAYAAAKGAIVQFSKAAALELAPHGIRGNSLAPGFYDTPLTRQHAEEVRARYAGMTPMGRFGAADEIVGPAVFLASSASSFVTGASVLCDGGWTAQ